MPAGGRSSCPGRAPSPLTTSMSSREPSASGAARCVTGTRSRPWAPWSRPTTRRCICRMRACTRPSPGTSVPRTRFSRSTCVRPTRRCGASRDHRASPPRPRRPRHRRGDRTRVVSDPLVAHDVRRRAPEAERPRPRRVPGGRRARRLCLRLALRRRVARDERRRGAGVPPPWHRHGAPRAAVRGHGGRPAPRLHARGARLQPRRDPALRTARIPVARDPARLLHRQPRGRLDHVARGDGVGESVVTSMGSPTLILGIETSCDETAAAVVTEDGRVLSSIVSSQATLHARYGGVVPEVASRRHLELVTPVVRHALEDAGASLDDVGRVAVTQGPGLVGALLIGVSAAKAIAWARGLPLVPVDHLEGHVASLYLGAEPVEPPFLCLLASGGHTLLLEVREPGRSERLGATPHDAAREAAERTRLDRIAVVGGVAANSGLRTALPGASFAPLAYCTDNAAMIASAARYADPLPYPGFLDLDAYASAA